MGYSIPNKLNFRELARTLGGLVFLVPDSHYWKDEILVSTSTVDYKTTDIAQLFTDLNATVRTETISFLIPLIDHWSNLSKRRWNDVPIIRA